MKFFRKKESWTIFLIKLAVMMAALTAVVFYLSSRFMIGYDNQIISSIPGKRLYVIDKSNKELVRGKRYAFRSEGLEPLFDDGAIMVKILEALPGDKVEINEDYQLFINGKPSPYTGLKQAERIGQEPDNFVGSVDSIPEGDYWFMGTHPMSFDSRYYGAVSPDRVIGLAYPIF